jgi:hypothetical protein
MSKTNACSWISWLYLTPAPRNGVGVEVQLLIEFLACPAPPCKLDILVYFLVIGE